MIKRSDNRDLFRGVRIPSYSIVPEQSVDDLMSRILDMQQDARIERIKQDIKEGEYRKQQKLHANIISMAA
ncbi:hypothetical protein [uncultured Cohaesibacter sp.]|uniref:hypothetical protein n=1 Tax=uncultured Cohaesibacter sp. TaxID=1002546 RepID=UPI00374A3E67